MSRRLKRWLIVLAALLVVGVAFIWTLPEIVKWQALKQIPAITGRAVSIDDIDINLFTGRVAIKKFRLAERDPAQSFVEFERLDVRVVPWRSLFGRQRPDCGQFGPRSARAGFASESRSTSRFP